MSKLAYVVRACVASTLIGVAAIGMPMSVAAAPTEPAPIVSEQSEQNMTPLILVLALGVGVAALLRGN